MSKKTEAAAPAVADEPVPGAPAVVVTPFDGVPDGLVLPRAFAAGDTIEGNLADVAVAEGWATREGGE